MELSFLLRWEWGWVGGIKVTLSGIFQDDGSKRFSFSEQLLKLKRQNLKLGSYFAGRYSSRESENFWQTESP